MAIMNADSKQIKRHSHQRFGFQTEVEKFPTDGKQPEGAAPGMFKQELDICECIGRTGDFNGNSFIKE